MLISTRVWLASGIGHLRHGSREKEWAHQHAEGTECFEAFPAVARISIENDPTNILRIGAL